MRHARRFFPFALPAALLATALPSVAAERMPPAVAAPSATVSSSSGGYEIRGFFGAGKNLEVSLRKAGAEASQWCKVGVKKGDLLVESADAKTGVATLVINGVRHRVRLAGEAPPEPGAGLPTIATVATPSPEEVRAQRKARIKARLDNMTPERWAAYKKVFDEKLSEVAGAHPGLFNNQPKTEEDQRQARALMVPIVHAAAEAGAKLPGKDGKITPLPEDFDALLIAEMNDPN